MKGGMRGRVDTRRCEADRCWRVRLETEPSDAAALRPCDREATKKETTKQDHIGVSTIALLDYIRTENSANMQCTLSANTS